MGTHSDMDPATLAGMPAGEPPPGVISNLISPVSRSWQVHLTIGLTIIPAVFLVALRIYAGLKLVRNLKLEDCKLCLVLVTHISMCVCCVRVHVGG